MFTIKRQAQCADPLDVRLAKVLVKPLISTPVHPNHLTVLSLLTGLFAAYLFASAHYALGATAYMLAVFGDHLDGELARLTGKTSKFGHNFDFVVGGIIYTVMFISIGYGLSHDLQAQWPLILGLIAGLSNPVIMVLRMQMELRFGFESVDHPQVGLFTIEDFIYLIGPLTWIFGILVFFIPYGLGALGYLAWTVWEFFSKSRQQHEC